MPDKKTAAVNVDVYLKAMLRVLSSPDEMPIFNGYLQESANVTEIFAKSKLPEELVAFMEEINAKLDQVIGILKHDKMELGFPTEIEVCNISASELLFKTQKRLEPGDNVEVVLPLSQMPLLVSGGIGKIERIRHPQFGNIWELSFTRIREQDHESIVQFVFQQERKRIRELHWD